MKTLIIFLLFPLILTFYSQKKWHNSMSHIWCRAKHNFKDHCKIYWDSTGDWYCSIFCKFLYAATLNANCGNVYKFKHPMEKKFHQSFRFIGYLSEHKLLRWKEIHTHTHKHTHTHTYTHTHTHTHEHYLSF